MIAVSSALVIYGGYSVVFGVLAAYSAFVVIRGRQLAQEVDDEEKYWR